MAKPSKKLRMMTEADPSLLAEKVDLPPAALIPPPVSESKASIGHDEMPELAGGPVEPKVARIQLLGSQQPFVLNYGLYVVSGATGSGKSITMVSLIDTINRSVADIPVIGVYQYINEVGAPVYGQRQTIRSTTLESIGRLAIAPFEDPARYLLDLEKLLDSRKNRTKRLILASDSITACVNNYELERRKGQATFEKGWQPMDSQFFVDLGATCVRHNVTLLGVVNPDVIPVTARLEAITEGIIQITGVGSFLKKERATGRTDEQTRLPLDSVARAARLMHYPARKQSEVSHPFNKVR